MRSSDDEGPADQKEKQFAQFKSANSFFLASEASEEERKLFLMREQKRKEMEKLEKQFKEEEQEYRSKYEGAKKQLQEKLKKKEVKEVEKDADNDDDDDDDEVSQERFAIKQEKNFSSAIERDNRRVEEEMQQLDEEEERERQDRLKQFIAYKEQKEAELQAIEKKTKKKNRVIGVDVNPQLKQKMETILTDADGVFENFDALYHNSPSNTIHFCGKLLTKPTEKEVKESDEVAAMLRENIQKKGEDKAGVEIIMLGLKEQYEKDGGTFTLCRKSSPKTQLCTKILTSGFFQNLILFTQHLKDNEQWDFDSLYCDVEGKKTAAFRNWYIRQKAKEYNIDEDSIVVTKLVEGSIKVEWTVVDAAAADTVIRINGVTKKLKLNPFFQHFKLSSEDFDHRGNMTYDDFVYEDVRGKWPYYLPVHCKRYGLRVSGRYDKKNDDWLMMDKNKNQWAVAFHGIWSPLSQAKKGLTVFNSIMLGIQNGEMLKGGNGQVYKQSRAVNNPKEKVGWGIYCSPHFQVTFDYTRKLTVNKKEYRLILQCRVRPSRIKVCERMEEYWVINESKNIRPYGVLLVKEENMKKIKSPQQLFGKKFKWKGPAMNPEEKDSDTSTIA